MKLQDQYDHDFYGWTMNTAQLLKEGKLDEIDFDTIIKEIEALGISEKHQLISRLSLVMSHLLKWQYQPIMRGHSWIYTIKEQRFCVQDILEDNPSLKAMIQESIRKAYRIALSKTVRQTSLGENIFPKECPYTLEQIMDESFFPE